MNEKLPCGTKTTCASEIPRARGLRALLAACVAVITCLALLPAPASATESGSFFAGNQTAPADQPGQSALPAPDTSQGVYVLVHETSYMTDGSEFLTWDAQLDEHGNALVMSLGQNFDPSMSYTTSSECTYDELGGMLSSTEWFTMTQEGAEPIESACDEVVIVDERRGRVESYMCDDSTVLLSYGESGRVEQITNIWSFNELSGTVARYDERGLPVWAATIEGRGEDGGFSTTGEADITWLFDAAGVPAQVRVRNVQTGAEQAFGVQADENGNVIAVLRDDSVPVLEFAYEYVANPSPLVAAKPWEFLADVVLLLGLPE